MISLFVYLSLLSLADAHLVIGDHAPRVSVVGLDGEPVSLPTDEIMAVTFFATWCGPCHDAISDLLAIRKSHGGLKILLVAVGEDANKVRRFLKERTSLMTVTVILDQTGTVARAWGQDRFPTTFLVDRNEIIRHINRGYGRGFRTRVQRWLGSMQGPE